MKVIEKALKEWTEQKRIEDEAKKKRNELSELIQEFFKIENGKKSQSFKYEGFKVELKKTIKTKIDQSEADELVKQFGDAAPFETEYKLDATQYKSLKKINEAFYKRCSEAVTFEPGSVSVKVEVVE